ncbi:MAG: DUF5130 domain-containing protein, partial [Actinomycetota bacterium]|nr:DUF5130 domain-containing protein [Actinomycetota bacterium]
DGAAAASAAAAASVEAAVSVEAAAVGSEEEAPVAAGDAGQPHPPRRDYRRVEHAVDAAEEETGLQFCVYLGPAGEGGSRDEAEKMFVEAGLASRPAVLVLVDPEHRRVEVVTAPDVRARVSDEAAAEAVATMTPRFAKGDIPGGLVAGIKHLAKAAGPGQAEPGSEELPDVLGPEG